MKQLLFIIILNFPIIIFGQESNPIGNDSVKDYAHSWRTIALRTGMGLQKSFYVEIGPSFVYNRIDLREGFGNSVLYSTFEWVTIKNIYGVKIGGEFGQNLSMMGLEIKYQTDQIKKDFVITPKIGLGFGFVNIFYGYNFSTNKYPFMSLGKSQFSVILNFTKKYFSTNVGN